MRRTRLRGDEFEKAETPLYRAPGMQSALPRVTARKPSRATSVASSHAKFGTWLEILFVPETSENSVRMNPDTIRK